MAAHARTGALALLLLFGCGDEVDGTAVSAAASSGSGGGEPATNAGLGAWPCDPGELEQPDGSCLSAGVDVCADGFVDDGDGGCEAILPADDCAPGWLALPGEVACRELAPCDPGTWGSIPVDDDTEHVDGAYTGGASDGSMAAPWTTVQDGVDAALPGAIVALAAGSYAEEVLIEGKSVRLWGRCPAEVAIAPAQGAAVRVGAGAEDSEIRDLAASGGGIGVDVRGVSGVVLDRLWIHQTANIGLVLQPIGGVPGAVVTSTLIEQATRLGIYVEGGALTLEDSVVRDVAPHSDGTIGRGISASDDSAGGRIASVVVRRALVERVHDEGILIGGSEALIEATLVRHVEPRAADGDRGRGIALVANTGTGKRSSAVLRQVVVEDVHDAGVAVIDSEASVERTVVRDVEVRALDDRSGVAVLVLGNGMPRPLLMLRRSLLERCHTLGVYVTGGELDAESAIVRDVLPPPVDPDIGRGVGVEHSLTTGIASRGKLRGCRITRIHDLGVQAFGADLVLEDSWVSEVTPVASGDFGRGVEVTHGLQTGQPTTASLRRCLIEDVHDVGVASFSATLALDSVWIRRIAAAPDGTGGWGLVAQAHLDTDLPASATVTRCLVEQTRELGIGVLGSEASIEDTIVRGVEPALADGLFGDALIVAAVEGATTLLGSSAAVMGSRFEQSARAGVSAFGGSVRLEANAIECNAIDLAGEPFAGTPSSFDDAGGNVCRCDGVVRECRALSTGLTAPNAL